MNRQKQLRPVQVLLVEDNPGDIQLTKEALENCKMYNSLHVADDGEKALDFLYKQEGFETAPTPDLIILDLNLPKKNGMEVLQQIKTDEKLRSIPVVILTTSKAEEDIARSYQLHANCYIQKPLDFEQFIKVVRCIENFWISLVILPPK